MIVDFVMDVLFGLANFVVGLLPQGVALGVFGESCAGTVACEFLTYGFQMIRVANYWLPLQEWADFVKRVWFPVLTFVVLYRFIKAFKPWGGG